MAVRHRLIEASVDQVWAVLEDSRRYGDWVVGPARSRPAGGDWPQVGAVIEYTLRLGPCARTGQTIVRRYEPPHWLELEVDSGLVGTARVAIEVRPWGEHSLVLVDEHPLRGLGGMLHNAALETLLQLRHRGMLGRLATVVEPREAKP